MNKYLFLGQLQALLEKQLEKEEVVRVMEYYENYMVEASDYGKSEEEILEELGNPEQLAKTILDNLREEKDILIKEADESTKTHSEQDKGNDDIGKIFDDLMKSTAQTVSEAGKVADVAAEKISEYFTNLFTNEDFFDDSEELAKKMDVIGEVKDEMTLDLTPYSDVKVMLANMSVKVYFTEAESMNIQVSDDKDIDMLLEVSHDDKTLFIRERKARVYSVFNSGKRQIEMFVPLQYRGSLKFECSNSKVLLKGKNTKYPSPIAIRCDNGSVEVKDAILGTLDVQCDNGRIELKHVICYKAILNCCNGLVKYDMLKNDYAKNIRLQANNGLIKVNDKRWALSHINHQIPARNDSQYELSVDAKCDNGMIRLTGF